jgi:hypothetical protein
MDIDFAAIAPYLKDPLVLIGFVLFIGFLFVRKIVTSGIIPPVGASRGAQILKLILHYGFIIGVLIIVLGFGLKYRDLSKDEQERAVILLLSELNHNLYVSDELQKNTETLTKIAEAVYSSLRVEKLRINYLLFPNSNKSVNEESGADLYNQLYSQLLEGNLLKEEIEVKRFAEQCSVISNSMDRTTSTIESLADRNGERYVVKRLAYEANLPILRKITIVPLTDMSNLYAKTEEERQKYFRVADSVSEYFKAVRLYCAKPLPEKALLGAALALERLTFSLLDAHSRALNNLSENITRQTSTLENVKTLE